MSSCADVLDLWVGGEDFRVTRAWDPFPVFRHPWSIPPSAVHAWWRELVGVLCHVHGRWSRARVGLHLPALPSGEGPPWWEESLVLEIGALPGWSLAGVERQDGARLPEQGRRRVPGRLLGVGLLAGLAALPWAIRRATPAEGPACRDAAASERPVEALAWLGEIAVWDQGREGAAMPTLVASSDAVVLETGAEAPAGPPTAPNGWILEPGGSPVPAPGGVRYRWIRREVSP